ncbi:hypothetical protein T492DRAFT_1025731 [Pavlovales sp. CCMP2436]|nr:hypothetical protein T492DRAFT_1025731 [Pavlovales sp. CCMP2436]
MNKRILGLSVAATAIVTTVFILYSFGASEPSSPGKVVPSNHRQPDNNDRRRRKRRRHRAHVNGSYVFNSSVDPSN